MATAARKPNWFAIWTSVIVAVIVIAVAATVVIGQNMANKTWDLTASAPDKTTGAVSVGNGDKEVDVYIDFMCPICGQFETAYGDQLLELASTDDITLNYHPVSILNHFSQGTNYSTRAGNAFYCVAETDGKAVIPFMTQLFKQQPAENSEGLTDDKLVSMAKDAGADIASCQKDSTWGQFVDDQTENDMPADPTSGSKGTPTVIIDGTYMSLNDIFASKDYFTETLGSGK